MAQKNPRRQKKTGKVGSDRSALKSVGGKGDFGIPAGEAGIERDYVAENTRASDRGAAQPASEEFEGDRTHGAGGKASGVGSSSGGDLDTDFIGVGTGGSGIAADIAHAEEYRPGPDDAQSAPETTQTARPDQKQEVTKVPTPNYRTMAQANADSESRPGAGSDMASNSGAQDDDSFSGESSSGDARGEDDNPDEEAE